MEELELHGHGGLPLHCLLHGDAARAAVVLPGAASAQNRLGGTPARPDLHFTRALLEEEGWSVLEVWWDADSLPDDAAGREAWRLDNARAAVEGIRAAGREPALFVARSLGTMALAQLRAADPAHAERPSIWIAPLLHADGVRAAVRTGGPRFLLCGGADAAHDPAAAAESERRGAELVVLDGASHGLDVGDAPASARALADGLERMRGFLRRLD